MIFKRPERARVMILLLLSINCASDAVVGVTFVEAGPADLSPEFDSRPEKTGPLVGAVCDVGASNPSVNESLMNLNAPECAARLCLWPAVATTALRPVDTGPLCSAECNTDADCADAEFRAIGDPTDSRCRSRFVCAVAFEVGPYCCKRLCMCEDLVGRGPHPEPTSCRPGASCPGAR